jgi:hypothetical protein
MTPPGLAGQVPLRPHRTDLDPVDLTPVGQVSVSRKAPRAIRMRPPDDSWDWPFSPSELTPAAS